jgi:hypothetical protein
MDDHEQLGDKAEAEANYRQEEVDRLGERIEDAKDNVTDTQADQLIPAPAEFDTDQEDEPEADYPAKR